MNPYLELAHANWSDGDDGYDIAVQLAAAFVAITHEGAGDVDMVEEFRKAIEETAR